MYLVGSFLLHPRKLFFPCERIRKGIYFEKVFFSHFVSRLAGAVEESGGKEKQIKFPFNVVDRRRKNDRNGMQELSSLQLGLSTAGWSDYRFLFDG